MIFSSSGDSASKAGSRLGVRGGDKAAVTMFGGFQLGSGVLAFQGLASPARFTEVCKPRVLVCVYFQYAASQSLVVLPTQNSVSVIWPRQYAALGTRTSGEYRLITKPRVCQVCFLILVAKGCKGYTHERWLISGPNKITNIMVPSSRQL